MCDCGVHNQRVNKRMDIPTGIINSELNTKLGYLALKKASVTVQPSSNYLQFSILLPIVTQLKKNRNYKTILDMLTLHIETGWVDQCECCPVNRV